ncbi:hypothetical protein BVY00_02225 [bacterium G20]|nr:hypothetical protein BVY00_02225 [bacterium G20]
MPVATFARHITESFNGAIRIMQRSFRILKKNPYTLIYPYLAIIFILLTSPFVGRLVFNLWHKVEQPRAIAEVSTVAPHALLVHLGLVTFSVFYTIFVTSYFTCMISVATLAALEPRQTPPLYGLKAVAKRFLRVSKFAVLAIFFFPLGIIAQRRKLTTPKGIFEAVSSSFSLSMAQLAPAIVKDNKGVFETICDVVDTLGKAWRESLVIRIGTFVAILLLGSISFLPKVVEHYWFDSHSAHIISWILAALLGASTYVIIRVISTVFTTTLYFEAKNKK